MQEIIFVSNFFGNGGAARVVSVLAENFVEKGYNVIILSYPNKDLKEYEHSNKVEHILLRNVHFKGLIQKVERIILLRNEIKKHKSAIIISFEYFMNMQTIVACIGLGNRVIISERNDPARKGGKFPTREMRNIIYRLCDTLVCQTPAAKEYFPLCIQKKTVIIPNAIKENLPEPCNGERLPRIVNFCRLEKQKNLPLLIEAFELFLENHHEYCLDIYGDGKEWNNLSELIVKRKLEKYVILHSSVSDIHERIVRHKMFVSSSDYEGLSNSMLEAMAIGLPTICTDCPCGGASMVIKDGINGLLVPVKDVKALASAMTKVAEDVNLSESLSFNARNIREEFKVEKIADAWERILKGKYI